MSVTFRFPRLMFGSLLSTLGLLLVGCGTSPSTPELTLQMGYQHGLVSLDPHAQNDGVTGAVLSAVYDTLVRLEPGAVVRPSLAERWMTPDENSWQFTLREGVQFHDGRPLTVDDVVASLRRARFDSGSRLATYMEVVDGIRVVDASRRTLEVTTTAPFPLLLSRIAMVAVVPRDFEPQHPIGTGPYRWVKGTLEGPIELRRFDAYWGEVPAASAVTIQFIADDRRLQEMMADRQLDVLAHVSGDFFGANDVGAGWTLERVPTAATTILGVNQSHPLLADPRFREALDLAIDRRALIESAFPEGIATVARSVVPAEVFGFNPDVVLEPSDPERARKIFSELGQGHQPKLHLDHSGVFQPVVDYLVECFASVGLEVSQRYHPYEEYYRRIERAENELFLFGWTFNFADASDFLDAVVHSRDPKRFLGLLNGSVYSNTMVDGWIEAAAVEARAHRRLNFLRWALARVAHDRPYLPLYHRSRLALVRTELEIHNSTGSWVRPQDLRLR